LKYKNKESNRKVVIFFLTIVFLPVLAAVVIRMESEQPEVKIDLPTVFIGMGKEFQIDIEDRKSGIKRFWVAILQDGKETTILEKRFPASGILQKGSNLSESISIKIEPKKSGFKDGKAMLRMMAVDYSWKSWGKGNRTYIEKEISIDTEAPIVRVLTRSHNISPGGSNVVAYELSEPCGISGVQVADHFYPGYPAPGQANEIRIAFFGLNDQQGSGIEMNLIAEDLAGNRTKTDFPHYIKSKKFKKDTILINDKFILSKTPEFEEVLSGHQLESPEDKFLFINRELRVQDKAVLNDLMQRSDPEMHWGGTFLRLPNSATKAGFGDRRTYQYRGKNIDQQTHLGIDLASVAMSPVPAANSGKVIYAKTLGIYGRTLVIDHGYGLFTLYAHLSGFRAHDGQMVKKGDIIGRTGNSGLSGGDHLHYSVLVSGTFVDPLEWWDAKWIHNNIKSKIDRLGQGE